MTMKLFSKQTEKELIIERAMYNKRYSLILDKNTCVGCEICYKVCPREAIEVITQSKVADVKFSKPIIKINQDKCSFCGICDAVCPFGAINLLINNGRNVPVVDKGSFPRIECKINVDESICPKGCTECESCPLGLVKVKMNSEKSILKVEIEEDKCPGCQLCEYKCPINTLHVQRIFYGHIEINQDICPEGCVNCADVCPIKGILKIENNGKVDLDDRFCVFCGVCRLVCPAEDALLFKRVSLIHPEVHSGAWNTALEKLTSTRDLVKDIRRKSIIKARDAVIRRFE